MLLSARVLDSVCNVNNYKTVSEFAFTEGDSVRIYFQLVDMSKDLSSEGYRPAGRRYIPSSPCILSVTFLNINDIKVCTKTAIQAFPTSDGSIFYINLGPLDPVRGATHIKFQLTETSTTTTGFLKQAITVYPTTRDRC